MINYNITRRKTLRTRYLTYKKEKDGKEKEEGEEEEDKSLTLSNLKAFADDKINVTQMIISVFDRVEHCGKRRKCC